jgi:hypothetical protein
MKVYGGMDVQIHIFLTLALVGGEWSASHPGCITPGERAPGTHWIGGWVPEPVWTTWRRENCWPYRDSNSYPSVVKPVASRYTDYAVLAAMCWEWLCHNLNIWWLMPHIKQALKPCLLWCQSCFDSWLGFFQFSFHVSLIIVEINLILFTMELYLFIQKQFLSCSVHFILAVPSVT